MDKVKVLEKYVPADAAPVISRWIDYFQCEFRVSRSRNSKLGDYRPPFRGKGHRISVNYNLNPYAFLVTTVHEFAHLQTWNEHNRAAKPHGQEWKDNFRKMMRPFFDLKVFPADINKAIISYLNNPAASSCSDLNLLRALQKYDQRQDDLVTVERLPADSLFQMKNGRVFRKGAQMRKRFRCVEVKTGLVYLFNPLAEVVAVAASA
ncbi:MAG TPA: sprT domain-containing protein [Sphingobacteriaceae bacterium]